MYEGIWRCHFKIGLNPHLPSFGRLAIVHVRFVGFNPEHVAGALQRSIHTMAVKIRLKRVGAKNDPAYRVVVTDGRSPRDGRFIEEIGTYLPARPGLNCTIKLERANYWVSNGAQPSETVARLMRRVAIAEAAAEA